MNKIVVNIEPGLRDQHVSFFENEKLEAQEAIPMNDLVKYLIGTCYTENCYNVHFMGNQQYIQGLIQELSVEENTQYNTHKILIEVN